MLNAIHTGDAALPELLIAHGLFGQARNWGWTAKALGDLRHVTSVDMRNHGDSPWYDSHSYADMAEDLAQMIPAQADVLGHSMGGKAAMALALTHPSKVRRLIVADIAPVAYAHDQTQYIDAMRALDLGQITQRGQIKARLGVDPGVAGFLSQSFDLAQKRWKMNLDVLAAEMPKITGFPQFETPFNGPVLMLAGGDSAYVQPAHRAEIKRLFPNARIAKIPRAGHWLHADRPKAVAAAIRAFLQS